MAFDFKKLTVLIAEDTRPMCKLVRHVLEALDIKNIHEAGNGEEAFKIMYEENPDIVITDWDMAPMDGIELTEEIRNGPLSPNRLVPIIFLTGYSSAKKVLQARDAGATEFVVKPFSAADLAKRVAYVINRPRDFIDCGSYFGPDRRRLKGKDNSSGHMRRHTDWGDEYDD